MADACTKGIGFERQITLIENIVSDKKTAAKLSLSLIAVAEGMSLLSVFFRKNGLCTGIDLPMMMQSLVPDDKNQVNPLRLKPKAWGSRLRGVKGSSDGNHNKPLLESLAPGILESLE